MSTLKKENTQEKGGDHGFYEIILSLGIGKAPVPVCGEFYSPDLFDIQFTQYFNKICTQMSETFFNFGGNIFSAQSLGMLENIKTYRDLGEIFFSKEKTLDYAFLNQIDFFAFCYALIVEKRFSNIFVDDSPIGRAKEIVSFVRTPYFTGFMGFAKHFVIKEQETFVFFCEPLKSIAPILNVYSCERENVFMLMTKRIHR